MSCKDPIVKETLNMEFKVLRNDLTTLTRRSKKDYYNRYYSDNINNEGNSKH